MIISGGGTKVNFVQIRSILRDAFRALQVANVHA